MNTQDLDKYKIIQARLVPRVCVISYEKYVNSFLTYFPSTRKFTIRSSYNITGHQYKNFKDINIKIQMDISRIKYQQNYQKQFSNFSPVFFVNEQRVQEY